MSNIIGSTIATFTCNSAQEIKDRGGDYDWVLNPRRAKNCQFLLCVSSQQPNYRAGFLLGKISGVEEVEGYKETHDGKVRYKINVSEVAEINIPNIDFKFLNPVKYCNLQDFNIDVSELHFEKVDKPQKPAVDVQPISLSIAEAKESLALHYGVEKEKIEILIRG
jgi:hypothetical protein